MEGTPSRLGMQSYQQGRPHSRQRNQPWPLRSRLEGQLMRPTVPNGRKSNGNRLTNPLLLTSFSRRIQDLGQLELKALPVKQAVAEVSLGKESTLQPSEPQHHRNPQRTQEVRDLEPPLEQMTMILTTFQLTASTGAQTRTRLLMQMQLTRED